MQIKVVFLINILIKNIQNINSGLLLSKDGMIMFKKPTKLVYPSAIFHIYNVDLPNDKYPSRGACHLAKNLRNSSHFTKNICQSRAFDYYNNVLSIFFHLPIYKSLNRPLDCFSISLYRIFRQTIEMFQILQKYQKSNFLHSN